MKKLLILFLAALSVASLAWLACGCSGKEETVEVEPVEQAGPSSTAAEAGGASTTVVMNGRSVMGGWMEHWGFTWEGPVEENGYRFDYRELDAANMPSSFAANVEGLAPGTIVFFKFCFADFDGGNLQQREDEIEEVIATAREKGLKLIIGNALPVKEEEGNPEMPGEYREFNAFLEQQAKENPDVWVYDFYGVLAGPDGWLKGGYATGDSHPNGDAYAALDRTFFPLLDNISGR